MNIKKGALQVPCHLHPPLQLWNMDRACWLWEKDPGFQNQVPEETSPYLPPGAQHQRLGAKFFLQLSREGMSNLDSLSKTILQGTLEGWQQGGNAGWTTSKSRHPCPCQSFSQGPSAEMTGRGSLLNCSSCSPHDPIGQGTELNWTELKNTYTKKGLKRKVNVTWSQCH